MPTMQDRNEFEACADRLRAVAEPMRLRIVQHLIDHQGSVTSICEALGETIVRISHHLGMLRKAGIVAFKKDGRESYYSLAPGLIAVNDDGKLTISFGCCSLNLPRGEMA